MPLQQEVQFLRDRARRLREMAAQRTPLSDHLRTMAHELDARADELERTGDRAPTNQKPPA